MTKFGWNSADNEMITLDDYILNGKYCSTGLAYPFDDNTAVCTY